MLSVVKKIRMWQTIAIISLIALGVVYFSELSAPTISTIADIENSSNQSLVLKGKNTPISKTDYKSDYPKDLDSYKFYMAFNPPLRMVRVDNVDIPLYASKWGIAKRAKLAVEAVKINDEMKEKLKLNQYSSEHPDSNIGDYILMEKSSLLLRFLMVVVFYAGWMCASLGLKRAREYVSE